MAKPPYTYLTATIAASGSTSGELGLGLFRPVAVILPAALTGTALTFTAAITGGGTFYALGTQDTPGTAYSLTYSASKWTPINERLFWGAEAIKVVSNGTEASARDFIFACLSLSD